MITKLKHIVQKTCVHVFSVNMLSKMLYFVMFVYMSSMQNNCCNNALNQSFFNNNIVTYRI